MNVDDKSWSLLANMGNLTIRTKRHKDTQAKAKKANKRISDYFPLRCFLGAFFIFVCLQAFCVFCAREIFE